MRPVARRERAGAGPVGDLLGLVEHLEDPLARRGRPLRLADPHAEHAQRHDQHHDEEVELDERPERERSVRDHAPADEQHGRLREQRDEREHRHVERPLAVGAEALVEDRLRPPLEERLLPLLLRERLHDVDADDRLLGDRRHVGHLLLHVAQHRVRHVAVAVGEHDDERRDRERHEREPPLEPQHHRGDADDREDVLEEEDEAVAEEEAHGLEVDRRARHELPGLVAVVVAEGQPQEVRVEAVAQVELDAERLSAGDEPAADHEHAP